MIRATAGVALLLLAGCHAVPAAAVYAGMGLVAGELKLGSALLDYMTARDARPPDCSATVPPPCVLLTQ